MSSSMRRASHTPSPLTPPADPASSPTSTRPRRWPQGWARWRERAGARAGRAGGPAPLDLHERYLHQRRLAVPAAAASWGAMMLVGLVACVALALRPRLPPPALRGGGAA